MRFAVVCYFFNHCAVSFAKVKVGNYKLKRVSKAYRMYFQVFSSSIITSIFCFNLDKSVFITSQTLFKLTPKYS